MREILNVNVDMDFWGETKSPFEYKTQGSAGFDIRSKQKTVIVAPNHGVIISTRLRLEIPEGYELQIRSRSGLAFKSGIFVLNAPGTIDSDYRDEIKVLLYNAGSTSFKIEENDRIAQGVFSRYYNAEPVFLKSEDISTTGRTGGFGSTGIK